MFGLYNIAKGEYLYNVERSYDTSLAEIYDDDWLRNHYYVLVLLEFETEKQARNYIGDDIQYYEIREIPYDIDLIIGG